MYHKKLKKLILNRPNAFHIHHNDPPLEAAAAYSMGFLYAKNDYDEGSRNYRSAGNCEIQESYKD